MVTFSRQAGSLGDEIAECLAGRLGWKLITRRLVMTGWLPEIAGKHELHMLEESPGFYLKTTGAGYTFAGYIEDRLKEEAAKNPLVIAGLASQIIFKGHPGSIHVRTIASDEVRTRRVMDVYGLHRQEAEKFIKLSDRKHKRYVSTIYNMDWAAPSLYDVVLKTDSMGAEACAEMLLRLTEVYGDSAISSAADGSNDSSGEGKDRGKAFVHPAEEEFASILDMYRIDWQYEPRTFPVEWDAEGNVSKAFTPDFYLPRFNTYIEITTMDQRYVSEKKKKVKRLRELYPDVNINIVFKRDFHSLLRRFGREEGDDV